MSQYKRRKSNLYNPNSEQPFSISRSKIDLFLECPRCFHLDRRLGLKRPSMPGWPLNSAVDQLLKNEFDLLRQKSQAHDLMKKYKIDAIPFDHPDLPKWRGDVNRFTGARTLHQETDLIIDGIIDDIWVDEKKRLLIVDYKATSTQKEISLDDKYKKRLKKQIEVYQWIFRQLGFEVADTGYFVYANAGKNRPKFDGRLEFEVMIIPHQGDDSWVEPTIFQIKKCLDSSQTPSANQDCEYCAYRRLIRKEIKD
jgi:CRISPR/Cas system-associated exonuclease Cas4 (RecB family)